jgi:surfeit locus 1 family protein
MAGLIPGLTRRGAVVLLAALLGAVLTFRLGLWQLDRAAQKIALQVALDQRRLLPPLPAAELAADAVNAAAQTHRRIAVEGVWLPAKTVFLDNRQMASRQGFYVLTPLQLADGSAVVVQRGWLPRNFLDRNQVSAPPLPAGVVRVEGRIATAPARVYQLGAVGSGPIRQNLDLDAYGRELGLRLRPLSIQQLDAPAASAAEGGAAQSPPAADGLLRDWPLPATGVETHYGYAFQWFALCALISGLYVWFQLIRPRRSRQP